MRGLRLLELWQLAGWDGRMQVWAAVVGGEPGLWRVAENHGLALVQEGGCKMLDIKRLIRRLKVRHPGFRCVYVHRLKTKVEITMSKPYDPATGEQNVFHYKYRDCEDDQRTSFNRAKKRAAIEEALLC